MVLRLTWTEIHIEEEEIYREMFKLPDLYDESSNDTRIEDYLEESSIQDNYKKLKHEYECYQQEMHVLRLKLEASEALNKELQETNETLEQSIDQYRMKMDKMFAENKEKYKKYNCSIN